MSTPRSKKKTPRKPTLGGAREQARPLEPLAQAPEFAARRAYPSAHELFSQGSAWRAYVTEALRSFVGPAALAGAVGLAGCAGTGDAANSNLGGEPPAATLTPVGQPTTTPQPPLNGGGQVVLTPLPNATLTPLPPGTQVLPPPPANPTPPGRIRHVVPAIQPTPQPQPVRGDMPAVQPDPFPPQANGGLSVVEPSPQPIQPPVQPPALGGEPPQVLPNPPPPQPQPNPNPPAVPGQALQPLPPPTVPQRPLPRPPDQAMPSS